jgi:hypothetical protein
LQQKENRAFIQAEENSDIITIKILNKSRAWVCLSTDHWALQTSGELALSDRLGSLQEAFLAVAA